VWHFVVYGELSDDPPALRGWFSALLSGRRRHAGDPSTATERGILGGGTFGLPCRGCHAPSGTAARAEGPRAFCQHQFANAGHLLTPRDRLASELCACPLLLAGYDTGSKPGALQPCRRAPARKLRVQAWACQNYQAGRRDEQSTDTARGVTRSAHGETGLQMYPVEPLFEGRDLDSFMHHIE
jgi:hypothetical protein